MSAADRIRRQQIVREAEGYLELFDLFADGWNPDQAVARRLPERALESLARLHPDSLSAHALYLQGQAFRALGQFAEAVVPLRVAAAEDPAIIPIWLALGWCYKRMGRLDLAIESLEQALAVDAGQAIIHYNLACYWSLARNRRHAIQFLSQALALDADCRALVDNEHDFDPIRSDPGFQALIGVIV